MPPSAVMPRSPRHGALLLLTVLCLALPGDRTARGAEPASGDVLRKGLDLVVERYWRPEEVVLEELAGAGLQRLERAGDAVLVTGPDAGGAYVLSVGEHQATYATRDIADVEALVARMREAMAFVEAHHQPRVGEGELPDLEVLALEGLLQPLDRHCRVIDERKIADFEARYRGTLSGIGSKIGQRNGVLTVVKVYENTPSERVGLLAGDVITHIDGVSTVNMRVADAIDRIRGPEGVAVTLTVRRPGEEGRRVFPIVREQVVLPTIDSWLLRERYAWLALDHFSQHTADEFQTKLMRHADEAGGELDGVIIDLRGNQGGSMLHASRIVNYFVDEGEILRTEGADGGKVPGLRHTVEASVDDSIAPWPVVVLVDGYTASGSEILAGGLKFLDRAVVIGTQTFGKGTVQKPYELRDQLQMKITVARYLVARDVWLSEVGITPDVSLGEVDFSGDGIAFPDVLVDPVAYAQPVHGRWSPTRGGLNARPALHIAYPVTTAEGDGYRRAGAPNGTPDLAVELAMRVLAATEGRDRASLLAAATPVVTAEADAQRARLRQAMVDHGIVWEDREPSWVDASPERLQWDVAAYAAAPPDGIDVRVDVDELKAGVERDVVLRVTNGRDRPLRHLRARTVCELPAMDNLSFVIGDLEPGESASAVVPVSVAARIQTRLDDLDVYLLDDGGPLGGPVRSRIVTRGTDTPRFALQVRPAVEEQEGGGRMVTFAVSVRNDGPVSSGRVRVSFVNPGIEGVELQERYQELRSLEPGAADEAQLRVLFQPGSGGTRLTLRAYDTDYGLSTEVGLDVDAAQPAFREDWYRPPEIVLEGDDQPLTARGSLTLVAQARDEEGMDRVMIWLEADKIRVVGQSGKGRKAQRTLPLHETLEVEPGSRTLRLEAVDATGIRSVRRYAIHGE